MDNNAEIGSFIGNVSVKKDGTLKENNSLIDAETFHALMNHTRKISPAPRNRLSAAAYPLRRTAMTAKKRRARIAKYKQFCKFSEGFGANKYRNIRRQKAQELFGKIKRRDKTVLLNSLKRSKKFLQRLITRKGTENDGLDRCPKRSHHTAE
jgi:ATP-dependent helicase/DNAse subunit B